MSTGTREAPATPIAEPLEVINIGLDIFASELAAQGATVVQVEWAPPLGGVDSARALEALLDEPAANAERRRAP